MPANKTQTSITGRLAVIYPSGHAARYYLIDSLGPIELIPVKEIGPLYRYDGVTITATGNLVSQENQRVLYMEEWAPLPSQQAKFPTVSGPQSTLMILIQFSNMAGSHPVSYFQNMLSGPSGSMNAYYVEVSYNSITVTGTTTSQWYTLPHPSSYYNVNTWSSCAYGGDFDKLTQDIISLVDPYVNFAAYAHFLFVTADSYVWGCRLGGYFQTNEGPIYGLAYVNENYPLSTFCHEFGHDLGLPDLYDYSSTDPYSFIDGWDEMGYDDAQHFSSWSKMQLGWIQPSRITTFTGSTVTATISRIEYSTGGCLALKILTSSNIYYLVETRQKVGFDVNIPSNAPDHGVLITKIDESKGSGQGIVRLVDANPSTQSGFDGDAVWQVGQTSQIPTYRFQVSVQSWMGTGFTITVASTLSVATDRTLYAQGESISYTGSGFTSSGAVRPCLSTDNDGNGICLIGVPNADSSGNVAGTMLVGTNIPIGPQKFWVYDVGTDRNSPTIQLTIIVLQLTMTVSYAVSGGGSPSPPTFNYVHAGISSTYGLSTTPTAISVDAGTSWSVTPNPLSGSTSSERWQSNQALIGTASTTTIVFRFYHQYPQTLSYLIVGDGTGFSAPIFTANSYGMSTPQTLTTSLTGYWYDAGSSWAVTNPLTGSTSSERWSSVQTVSGTITSSRTLTFTYYHQFLQTLSYAVVGGGSSYSAPTFAATRFGGSVPQTLSTSASGYWFDSGSTWTLTNPLAGSTSSEQWITPQPSTGSISSAQTVAFAYQHQYYLTMQANPSGGGTVTPTSGWQNAGAAIAIQATSIPGYSFGSWTGTGPGSSSGPGSLSIIINGPITEIANFLRITSISLAVSPSSILIGSLVGLSGSITPNPGAVQVTLSFSGDSGSTWASFITLVTDGSGSYSTSWTPPYPASYLLKTSWSGNSQYAGSASTSASLTVTGTATPIPTLLLSAPSSASRGQSVTLSIAVFNPTGSLLNANVTVQITGPGNYVSFDVIQVRVAASSQLTSYYDWTAPNQPGTYNVTVGLLSTQPGGTDTGAIRYVTGTIQVT